MRNKKTFGLTEIVIGSLLIATVFTGLVSTFISIRRYIDRSQRRLRAINIARSYFNTWYNGLPNLTGNNFLLLPGGEGSYRRVDFDTNGDGQIDYSIVNIRINF
ncbi:MAG: hypothetical protein NC822_00460 [Candidatus Omnitrophica bacterium]|nr:hypothetical protein [Candidatus Omnitrophota bacterium]MCM8826015.1 hypothetical protein [Candidatus Omnitrophota bacterium]